MKKKMITLVTLAMITVSSIFAGESKKEIGKTAQSTFSAAFTNATDVQWTTASTYYEIAFRQNNLSYNALVSKDGELIAVSRHILSTELPAALEAVVPKVFSRGWIKDLVKYSVGEGTRYFMTVENAHETVILESVDDTEWSVMDQKTK